MINRIKLVLLTGLFVFLSLFARADEGMWLPMFIQRLNYVDMQKMGLQLTPEEIYSVNNSSLKDAVVQLGGFCTGEIISDKGLMLTNHHCAYDAIQSKSTVENDYLTDGFWAMKHDEEIPIEGLTASFLVRMDDVTEVILEDVKEDMDYAERKKTVKAAIDSVKEKITEKHDNKYKVEIKSFFEGNEYYLFLYEIYQDVRLVGAPPSSVGKFGGDTDNWMWPRHTGDFALLRVYAGEDNEPAAYSTDNKPFQPRHFLPVSLTGVEKDDFAMVMGYPGSTDRYLSSSGVKAAIDVENPTRVKIRRRKLDIIEEGMRQSDDVRIKYSSKHAQISNYWKYFKGQTKGLKNLDVYDKKSEEERVFMEWANENPERKEKYGSVIDDIKESYKKLLKTTISYVYVQEAVFGVELNVLYMRMLPLYQMAHAEEFNEEAFKERANKLKPIAEEFFKNYDVEIDKKLFAAMMEMYYNNVPKDQQPEMLKELGDKYAPDFKKMADKVYKKTVFKNKGELYEFFTDPKAKTITKDDGYNLFMAFLKHYRSELQAERSAANARLNKAKRLYIDGVRKMNNDEEYYPDANFTMRLTYGQVLPYEPRDGVKYKYYTTLEGVIEKYDPVDPEFIVPEKLQDLYVKKDYGKYGKDGELRVCFITNTDITGGNSGSPVIDAHGHLIGCAFDGNWEAMSGDIAFEPDLQRTISVDIRYILFIIDKFAGAGHLVDEMKLITQADLERQKTAEKGKKKEEKEPVMQE